MATLHITETDLEEVIRRDWWHALRYQSTYPVGALLAAGLAYPINTHLSAIALGAAMAWLWSVVLSLREIRPHYIRHYASLKEPWTLVVENSGLRVRGDPGESYLKWDHASIYNYPGAFAVYENEETFVLLPKRHLSADEILVLESKSKFRAGW